MLLGMVLGCWERWAGEGSEGGGCRGNGGRRGGCEVRRGCGRPAGEWVRRWATLSVAARSICGCAAMDGGTKERMMLFNTRGLAVSTSTAAVAGAGYFLARAALSKLAFIATTLSTKGIEAGVLLELICDMRQAKWLGRWFRNRGYTDCGWRAAKRARCRAVKACAIRWRSSTS